MVESGGGSWCSVCAIFPWTGLSFRNGISGKLGLEASFRPSSVKSWGPPHGFEVLWGGPHDFTELGRNEASRPSFPDIPLLKLRPVHGKMSQTNVHHPPPNLSFAEAEPQSQLRLRL